MFGFLLLILELSRQILSAQFMKYPIGIALIIIVLTCCSDDQTEQASNDNTLVYGEQSYPMDAGMFRIDGGTENHYHVDIATTDGSITPTYVNVGNLVIPIWRPLGEKVEFWAEMYSAGTTSFTTGTFEFSTTTEQEVDDPSLKDISFFNEAYVGFDADGDNVVREEEEIMVSGGTITVKGSYPDYEILFDLQLENGRSVTGSYSGEFTVID